MNQDCKTLSAALWAVVIVTASLLTAQLPAQAEVSGAEVRKTTPGPARTDAAFRAFLIGLWPEAQAAGVSRQTFDAALSGLKPDFKLPDLLLSGEMTVRKVRQAEFTREPRAYLDRAYLARLAKTGRGLAQKWRLQLDLIEAKFGVDRQTVLAIWGRETAFGTYKPKHDAIRVLATQGFAGRRATLFRGELIDALRLLEAGVPRAKMRASWAGAMGMTQFMPSEFFKHKHDFAGDGYADLFNSVPDALASAARQLSNKGWQSGRTWGYEVVVPTRSDCAEEGPPGARSLRAWASGGFVRVAGRQFPDAVLDDEAYLMSPAGSFGPSFLVLNNFKVLRAYNTSDLYASFVGHLADRIVGSGDFVTAWTPIGAQQTKRIRNVQAGLQRLGYPISIVDGFIGSNTRRQVGQFQRRQGLRVTCWPTAQVEGKLLQLTGQ